MFDFLWSTLGVPLSQFGTYHASCMSWRPGGQRAGTRREADAVGVAHADSWPGRGDGRGGGGRRFDSLLRGHGVLTAQQGQPQGREALLLTGRKRSVV